MGPGAGVDAWEQPGYDRLVEAVLGADEAHFVATLDRERDLVVVDGVDGGRLVFDRSLEVVEGSIDSVFPSTDQDLFASYDAMLAAFENPGGVTLEGQGYDPDGDPRVGWLPLEDQSYPLALRRLAVVFDAPDAPDALVAWRPWAAGGAGTHGGLGLLQSRATLILSGAGVRSGVVLDDPAALIDVAPTVLAALGAETTGGVGADGVYEDGLYLTRQDGRVLVEALTADVECDAPDHVIVALLDGLQATEINHQVLDDDAEVELPTLSALANGGVIYRFGAVSPYPSMSAAGRMTAATGVWSGHHGFVHNSFYRRTTGEVFDPFALFQDPQGLFEDPDQAVRIYDAAIAPGFETLAQAAHRGIGQDAFVAVFNDVALGGGDEQPGGENFALDRYDIADELAVQEVQTLLRDPDRPIPTILQLALVTTDKGGEGAGPHSGLLREKLVDTDRRLGLILQAYERVGALDRTLIAIVSDHGMELQDPTRRSGVGGALGGSGVRHSQPGSGLIYLRTVEIHAERLDDAGDAEGGLLITVINHDDSAPVAGASVRCPDCGQDEPLITSDIGQVFIPLPLAPADGDDPVTVQVEHPQFNPQELVVASP